MGSTTRLNNSGLTVVATAIDTVSPNPSYGIYFNGGMINLLNFDTFYINMRT
jgi:hypothetical protein